jgi:alpha-L-rhamnosidase
MKGWVNYMKNKSVNYLWNTNWHYGDWLFYSPADDLYGDAAITNKHFIAQCFFAHSTQLLINAATILGKTEDVKIYSSLLENIKKAFLYEYVTQGGRFISETQTAYTLALQFDMVPESMRPLIANRLVENIQYYNNHLTTGFLGTPYLMHVLTKFGKTETAYKLLFQKSYPSWLYPVTKGATTIWERWDGIKPDGSFQNPGMNSFNHYAYGAIGDWLYRVVAGINEDAPGYKKILLKPIPGGNLKFAKASFESIYGTIISDWKIQNGLFCYSVQIPANSTAVVEFPYNQPVIETTISGKELKNYPAGSKIEKGSGKYYFIVKL